jgi:hypothetical protein
VGVGRYAGARSARRLGIDGDGRLVVAELKRDQAPDTVEMQAIKYAAGASRFTEDTLVEQFALFRAREFEARRVAPPVRLPPLVHA